MVETAATIWADGPVSMPSQPDKSKIRAWGAWIENILNSIGVNSGYIFETRATLLADLSHVANSMAWVFHDPTVSFNGIYQKVGSAGSGSWSRVADLPYSFISAVDNGEGSANAIHADTSIPVNTTALVQLNISRPNDASPVTVSFNGGDPLTIKANSGADIDVGALTAGMIVLGTISGNTFRLSNDESIAATLYAVRTDAQTFAGQAASSASLSSEFANQSSGFRDQSQVSAENAAENEAAAAALVTAAQAGFAGFPSSAAYDFGFVADATTYFNQDWGTI